MKRLLGSIAACLLLAACSGGGPTPEPSGGSLSVPVLKIRVLDAMPGPLDYCDPDVFPVAHGTPIENALEHFAQMRRDRIVYGAITSHLGITPIERPAAADLVRIYQLYKQLAAIQLQPSGDRYRFSLIVTTGNGDSRVDGTVARDGAVDIESTAAAARPNCPICLARRTMIATPSGPVRVDRIRVGMTVWSVDRAGHRIRATVLRTRHRAANGELLRITLANGRSVVVSPGHPAPNGRLVGQLSVGHRLGGVRITGIARIPYRGFTYDLLPSGPTGDYFADGVLLGSTLAREPIS